MKMKNSFLLSIGALLHQQKTQSDFMGVASNSLDGWIGSEWYS